MAASLFRFQRNVARLAKPLMIAVGLSAPVAAVLLLRSKEEPVLPAAAVEPAPIPGTDPVDSLFLAAQGAATYARQRAVTAGATRAQLASGDSVRTIADSLARLDRKAEAAVLLTSAASLWEKTERQSRPAAAPSQPSGTGTGTSTATRQGERSTPAPVASVAARTDSQTVSDYYYELARAIESRQLGEVKRLLPNLTPNEERNWRNLFDDRGVDSIDARFTVLNVTRRESVTYARVQYSQNVVKGTRSQSRGRTLMATLTLGPQGWRQIREENAN